MREDGRHGGKIFGVGCLQVVAASVCGLVQLVENGVNLAVIKEKIMRIPAGAQSVVQFRQLVGCGKVAHTTGPVEDERQTVSDGGNVLFGKLNTVYACDERQVRYAGVLTAEEVKKNFDKWWDYAPPTPVPVPEKKKLEDRVKELEAQSTTMADQLTSTQMALCDVYEQVLSATSTATE